VCADVPRHVERQRADAPTPDVGRLLLLLLPDQRVLLDAARPNRPRAVDRRARPDQSADARGRRIHRHAVRRVRLLPGRSDAAATAAAIHAKDPLLGKHERHVHADEPDDRAEEPAMTIARIGSAVVSGILVTTALHAIGDGPSPRLANVILITLDTTRAD